MEEEIKTSGKAREYRSVEIGIIVTQIICVAVITAGILAAKSFFPECYEKIKSFYEENFLSETSLDDFTEGDGDAV